MSLLRVESSAASLRRKRLAAYGRIGSDHLKKALPYCEGTGQSRHMSDFVEVR